MRIVSSKWRNRAIGGIKHEEDTKKRKAKY